MPRDIHSHVQGRCSPWTPLGEELVEEACAGKPQAGFGAGEAHNGAGSHTGTRSRPKGERNREHKAALHTGGVLATRLGKPIGDPPHRTAQHCAATSTSDSSSGYGHPVLWQYAAMNRTGTTRRWRESSVPATACSGPTACGRGRCRYADSRYTNSVCVLAGNGMCPKGRPRGSSNGDTGAGDLASAMYGCRLGIVRH
jgi:hypothetical protein